MTSVHTDSHTAAIRPVTPGLRKVVKSVSGAGRRGSTCDSA